MKRRQALGMVVLAGMLPLRAFAQAGRPVIGLLDAGDRKEWWVSFRQQMRELGYTEGRNIAFETRAAGGRQDRLPGFADDLVRRKVDLIVTSGTVAASAAKHATDTIPIVIATGTDPVSLGLARSLSHPGENLTGLTSLSSELTGKRFALLREIFPTMSRVAVLWHRENPASAAAIRDLLAAADAVKVGVQNLPVRDAQGIRDAVHAAAQERSQALLVVQGPLIYNERRQIAEHALRDRLPTMNGAAEYVDVGGLVSYAPSYPDLFRRAAVYADKILKGAKPGDMPIEQPIKFELVVNQATAKAIGVVIPQAVMLRADRVVGAI